MTEGRTHDLVAIAWRGEPSAPPAAVVRLADDGWRRDVILSDQSALDRAGSRGRTPPPFHDLVWRTVAPGSPPATPLAPTLDPMMIQRWAAFRVVEHPAWDDTTGTVIRPQIKQISLVKARPELTPDEFVRHYREHVVVARVHHPAICRYAQHDVTETAGIPPFDAQGISELWFADESSLVDHYYAGPDSIAVVRADNREYIDFSGTLSLLVTPDDDGG